ncbi:MAG: hypothetical protein U9Q40_00295 [Campylobacterota bacterium]|nr:hypothetical protein [Campylobacterota bacterium]
MNEIKLSVDDAELETVLTILQNLKTGLIKNIETNGKSLTQKMTQYQPKTNTIIKEENSGTNDSSGKYANAAAYRARLKKRNSK